MITNYYTLRALLAEWRPLLDGLTLVSAFSQTKDELTLAFADDATETMLRLSIRAPMQYLFRVDGFSRARRNVAELFDEGTRMSVTGLRLADRDRMIYFYLSGGLRLQIMLFGPRANIFLVSADGTVLQAFQRSGSYEGRPAPEPRPAPSVDNLDDFIERWRTSRRTISQALASAMPLFDQTLAHEAAVRAGLDPGAGPSLDIDRLRTLYQHATQLEAAARQPRPIIYWDGAEPAHFSLLPLSGMDHLRGETFPTVDEGVSVFARSTLARIHFKQIYDPLEKALSEAVTRHRARAERMEGELAQHSRADRYERNAHLLMANPMAVKPGCDKVVIEDIFASDGATIEIALDPALTPVENAERYYDRARRTRRARVEAKRRLVVARERADRAAFLLVDLQAAQGLKAIRTFRRERADELSPFMQETEASVDRVPFRRFDLGGGYEVWVGRNARQNDDLTFRYARKYDLWMHARGAPGSHAVLRLPGRTAHPDRRKVQQAAAIAAYFSKARGSGLVPVIVAERKHVRKPKGAESGAVVVDREDVLLVEPGLPS